MYVRGGDDLPHSEDTRLLQVTLNVSWGEQNHAILERLRKRLSLSSPSGAAVCRISIELRTEQRGDPKEALRETAPTTENRMTLWATLCRPT